MKTETNTPAASTAVKLIVDLVEDLDPSSQVAFYQEVTELLAAFSHHQEENARWAMIFAESNGTQGPPPPAGRDSQETSPIGALSRFLRAKSGKRPSVAKASMAAIAVHGPMNTREILAVLEGEGYSVAGGKNQIRSSLFGPRKKGKVKFLHGKYRFPSGDAKEAFLKEAGLA